MRPLFPNDIGRRKASPVIPTGRRVTIATTLPLRAAIRFLHHREDAGGLSADAPLRISSLATMVTRIRLAGRLPVCQVRQIGFWGINTLQVGSPPRDHRE